MNDTRKYKFEVSVESPTNIKYFSDMSSALEYADKMQMTTIAIRFWEKDVQSQAIYLLKDKNYWVLGRIIKALPDKKGD